MNERQAILYEVSKLSDEHCEPCQFNNVTNNNLCKFYCKVGLKLQEYGAELLGVDKIEPEHVTQKQLTQNSIETIRTDGFRKFIKLREDYSINDTMVKMDLSTKTKRHYLYVNRERMQLGISLNDEVIRSKTNFERAVELMDEGIPYVKIAEKLKLSPQTIYNYKVQSEGGNGDD